MIHILPYMKFTIQTGKSPKEVHRIMATETAVRDGTIHFLPDGTDFLGEVEESDFKVVPRLAPGFRNSFQPVIVGHIRAQGSGAAVDIHMRLTWDVFAFCIVWFGLTGLWFAVCLCNLIVGHPDGWKGIASATGFVIFGQLLVRGGFYIPARKARQRLEELLEGEAEEWRRDDD